MSSPSLAKNGLSFGAVSIGCQLLMVIFPYQNV
jgi:hypothetical protein